MMRVVIVDDELQARNKIRRLLQAYDAEVIGEASDAVSAVQLIAEHRPDLLFLDVQLRGSTAFDVVQQLGPRKMPPTIFATAFHEHAVRAFELNAVDYLLKPFTRSRFDAAIERVLARGRGVPAELLTILSQLGGSAATPVANAGLRWLMVRTANRGSVLVALTDVDWIEAAGNYVFLHVGAERHVYRHTLSGLLEKLDASQFVRVHRSTVVNLARIERLSPLAAGDYVIHLKSGSEVRLSRSFKRDFDRLVGAASDDDESE